MIRPPLASVSVQNTLFLFRIGHIAEEPNHATSVFPLHYAPIVQNSESQHLRAFPSHGEWLMWKILKKSTPLHYVTIVDVSEARIFKGFASLSYSLMRNFYFAPK